MLQKRTRRRKKVSIAMQSGRGREVSAAERGGRREECRKEGK